MQQMKERPIEGGNFCLGLRLAKQVGKDVRLLLPWFTIRKQNSIWSRCVKFVANPLPIPQKMGDGLNQPILNQYYPLVN